VSHRHKAFDAAAALSARSEPDLASEVPSCLAVIGQGMTTTLFRRYVLISLCAF